MEEIYSATAIINSTQPNWLNKIMKSIVLIEDHPAIRMAIKNALEKTGEMKIVFETSKGLEGLAYVRKHHADLILLDLELPDIDGFDFVKRARKYDVNTKVVFISGKNEDLYSIRAIKMGVCGFISKARELSDIVLAVKMVLNGYSSFTQDAIKTLNPSGRAVENIAFAKLSNRELAIARLLAQGLSNNEIGKQLIISPKTVSTYKMRIFEKLYIKSIVELIQMVQANEID